LIKYDIICNNQSGFRQGHSTTLAIIGVYNYIFSKSDHQKYTYAIFLGLQKAFDCVNHKILMSKLCRYGIREIAYQLYADYLTHSYQFTAINYNTKSNANLIKSGVP